jgi:hypothetical protein
MCDVKGGIRIVGNTRGNCIFLSTKSVLQHHVIIWVKKKRLCTLKFAIRIRVLLI